MLRTLLVLCPVLVAACGDDHAKAIQPDATATADAADTTPIDLKLKFTPKVGTAPFACGQTYAAMGAEQTTITPRDFRFYASSIALIRKDGTHVPVQLVQDNTWQYQDVALLDFEDFTGGCQDGTPETNTIIHGTVPAGTYDGVAFDIGIPDAMDHVDLTTLPSPMNLTGLWWGWGYGHIFLAVVTHTDITMPTPGTNDHYIHVGSIGCTGDPSIGEPAVCTHPDRPHVELTGFDPTTTAITADYGAVIAKSNLTTSAGCHSMVPMGESEEVCAYPFDFIGLNWITGSVTPTTQKLFRID